MNRRRTLLFRHASVHYAKKDQRGEAKSDSSRLDIEVRACQVNRDSRKPFAEFELLVSLRVRTRLGHSIQQWSVWKRYSQMQRVHKALQNQYGWQVRMLYGGICECRNVLSLTASVAYNSLKSRWRR